MERYLIKFQKIRNVKFLSHLDTLRTLHRAFKRADLPIAYSKGFNPHPSISIASPLSVGVESVSEYADIELDKYIPEEIIVEKLNHQLPNGLKLVAALHIKEKLPAAMAAIYAAEYKLIFKNLDEEEINVVLKNIINSSEINMMKRTKSGEKLVNVRPFIFDLEYIKDETQPFVKAILQNSNKGSLNPDILVEIIKQRLSSKDYGYVRIIRTEIYAEKNGFVDFLSYFSS